ncbi:carboxylesterase [Pantoea sp. At-9b]|uniref:alpha/beta hydrolase n=1 Tax=Pantoea sp. (strain At-9b) TaxID=592316 RepID=UPI0001B3FEA4|nr:alpha/beta fold hydrolase [Pantoea sp. At-9b]ADU71690.1 conserved hypothetical protein [Pantoea sp. At-9b]
MAMARVRQWLNRPGPTLIALLKFLLAGLVLIAIIFFVARIYQSERGAPLHRWHTWSADEMSEQEIDHATFADYQARETLIFAQMKRDISDTLSDDEKTPLNRYYAQSLVYPARFQPDWNRSFILLPQGTPRGAVVLLHGLTDAPYSMRYLAEDYRQQGFVAVVPRLPGHGTAPGALTTVNWEQWLAVTRLAVREATRLAGTDVPLHLVGYSNGGALVMKYALDALTQPELRQPQQIVLLSPMIGVTTFARFAGLAGLPAILPAFAKAAWLNVMPEFNPYKYNSFPVKAARQSWLLTQALQQQILQQSRQQGLAHLAPILTFQSVMDSTVSTRAVVASLYRYLQSRGNQLVIFDINQASELRALLRPDLNNAVSNLLPAAPRPWATTVITNVTPGTAETEARTTPADQLTATVQPLHIAWPPGMYSLSHVAVPFPLTDSLYGLQPTEKNQSGISLGAIALRGETNTLTVGLDTLMRANSNPFFDYMMTRINHHIACSQQPDFAGCLAGQ